MASPPPITRTSFPRSELGVAIGTMAVGHALVVGVNSMQGARSAVSSAIAREKTAKPDKEFTTRVEAGVQYPKITIYRIA